MPLNQAERNTTSMDLLSFFYSSYYTESRIFIIVVFFRFTHAASKCCSCLQLNNNNKINTKQKFAQSRCNYANDFVSGYQRYERDHG